MQETVPDRRITASLQGIPGECRSCLTVSMQGKVVYAASPEIRLALFRKRVERRQEPGQELREVINL